MKIKRQHLQELFQKRCSLAESKEEQERLNEIAWIPLLWGAGKLLAGVVATDVADRTLGWGAEKAGLGSGDRISSQAFDYVFGSDEESTPQDIEAAKNAGTWAAAHGANYTKDKYAGLYTPTNTEPTNTGDTTYKNDKPEIKLNTTDTFGDAPLNKATQAGINVGKAVAPLALIGGAGLLAKALVDKKKKKKQEESVIREQEVAYAQLPDEEEEEKSTFQKMLPYLATAGAAGYLGHRHGKAKTAAKYNDALAHTGHYLAKSGRIQKDLVNAIKSGKIDNSQVASIMAALGANAVNVAGKLFPFIPSKEQMSK